jgi:hypothetical protein
MKSFTNKSVEKLLQSLNNDPRLQALDDITILSEEQYPVAFDALLIMRLKDTITLTTTVDTLSYNDASTAAQSIPSNMRSQLKEKQIKSRELLQLNPTIDNPLDVLTFSHWVHRINYQHLFGCCSNGPNGRRHQSWHELSVCTQH